MKKFTSILILFATIFAANSQNLPQEFSKLPGTWNFSQVYADGQDMTSQFVEGQLGGVKHSMTLKVDGTLIFSEKYTTDNTISSASWEYVPKANRGQEPAIDFRISSVFENGSATEKYTLVSVDDKQLVYENKLSGIKFIFVR